MPENPRSTTTGTPGKTLAGGVPVVDLTDYLANLHAEAELLREQAHALSKVAASLAAQAHNLGLLAATLDRSTRGLDRG